MKEMTYLQSLELIDLAAKEDRVYHYNGGQAYIRLCISSNVLMVIDHTSANRVQITLHDGTKYFHEYAGYNYEHSHRMRQSTSLVEWYQKHTQLVELDLV